MVTYIRLQPDSVCGFICKFPKKSVVLVRKFPKKSVVFV